MKTLIFALLLILCFSCSKETEPFNPLQTFEAQGRGNGNQHTVVAKVELACGVGEQNANMTAHVEMNMTNNRGANKGEYRFQLMDQNQNQYREIVAAIHQFKVENGMCWMIGQVTHDSKGCEAGTAYQNHGEYCPYRDGDCDQDCDCECKCECTCNCACGCQGDCPCDCACECCQCLQHRLRTRLRGAENKAERTRLRAQLRNRECGCDCSCDCPCDCPDDCQADNCDCCCHANHGSCGQFNCHDWCCTGECCNCDCCQNGGDCLKSQNRKQNRNSQGMQAHYAGNGHLNQWQAKHMMHCRVGQIVCIRLCDGERCPDGCDQLAWRWCDEKSPVRLQDRLQWQLCQKKILQGDITIN